MQIYYINLARRPDRREFMESQFARLGLGATRIEAVTPDDVPPAMRAEFCNPDRNRFTPVTTLCCSLSHIRACEALLSGNESHALILEDDAVLSSRLPAFLAAFDLDTSAAQVVRIETSLRGVRTKRVEREIAGISLVESFSWEGGSAGYIVDRQAAAILVQSSDLRFENADEVIFHPFGRHSGRYEILQTIPGLCIQTHLLNARDLPNLGSDLNSVPHWSHTDQSRLARGRRFAKLVFRREVVMGGQQFVHQLLGARKRAIPFLP